MKIGILTFHSAHNYGAMLQAYALETIIEDLKHDVEFINFIPENEYIRKSKKNFLSVNKAFIARNIYSKFFKKSINQRNKMFDDFGREYLKVFPVEKRIREFEVESIAKKYDALVCGSDQIWSRNKKLYDRSDVFYLNFPYDGKKISYSASFGDSLKDDEKEIYEMVTYLKKFDYISVREQEARQYLKKGGIDASVCLDPTLLLNQARWESLSPKPSVNEEYILYYSVNSRKYSISMAQKISKMTGLKVIELNPHPKSWNSGFKKQYSSGPKEFLGYIKHAKYVVTNSFHGTAFSIIFNKPFISVFDESNGKMIRENRKANLLEAVGLESCMKVISSEVDLLLIENIDWKSVKNKLDDMVKKSIEYLTHSLGD